MAWQIILTVVLFICSGLLFYAGNKLRKMRQDNVTPSQKKGNKNNMNYD